MDEFLRYNWAGYGRPSCKLTLRLNPDPLTVAEAMIHDYHADVAEYMLRHSGILPALEEYIVGVGREYR